MEAKELILNLLKNGKIEVKEALILLNARKETPIVNYPYVSPQLGNWFTEDKPKIYGDICSCNPKNGGSGICGCVIGNKIIE